MGKALIILVLLVVGGFAIVLYMGSRVVAPTPDDKFTPPELPSTQDVTDAVKKGAKAAKDTAQKAAHEAKVAADKAGLLSDTALKTLKLEKEPIDVKAGGSTEVKIIRTTKELKPLKLELLPARDSNIRASGGEFKQGQTETTITVEADAGAHDASLTIKGSDDVKIIVAVRVK